MYTATNVDDEKVVLKEIQCYPNPDESEDIENDDKNPFFNETFMDKRKRILKTICKIKFFMLSAVFILIFLLIEPSKKQNINSVVPIKIVQNQTNQNKTKQLGDTFSHKRQAKMLIHYHKTGKRLSRYFKKTVMTNINIEGHSKIGRKRYHDQTTMCPTGARIKPNSFFVMTSPDLYCDNLNIVIPDYTKVIHMVRNPIEMAISAYFYHIQNPSHEHWIFYELPCLTDQKLLDFLSKEIGIDSLNQVVEVCNNYWENSEAHIVQNVTFKGRNLKKYVNPHNFFSVLKSLPVFDGLRFMTAFSIINVLNYQAGGDILRMAVNALHLKNNSKADVLSIEMKEWIMDMSGTSMRAMNFLFGDAVESEKKEVIGKIMEEIFEDSKIKNAEHITYDKINKDEKIKLGNKLRNDKIVGPVLIRIENIINEVIVKS